MHLRNGAGLFRRGSFSSEKGLFLCDGIFNMKGNLMKTLVSSLLLLSLCLVPSVWAAPKTVILATTTSTQDSGLLDVLVPMFEKESGYTVKTVAVGSGQAMKMGEKGEADVLLVHSPDAEKKFISEGFGVTRRLVMHNDFIILGPPADPARVKGSRSGRGHEADRAVKRTVCVAG